MTTGDYVVVALLAAAIAGSLAGIGLLLLRPVRGRSLSTLVNAGVAVALGPIVAGMVGTTAAMFVIDQNLTVALLVAVICGAVGAGLALSLGRRLVGAARALRDSSAGIGEPGYTSITWLPTVELRELARALDDTHRRLIQARTREHALEASRRELVAWVSHDLRTPLSALRAMAEALEDGVAADPPRYIRQMRQQVERLDLMVDDLFLLSRLHAGVLRLRLQWVVLGDLIDDVVATLDPLAQAGGVRLCGGGDGDTSALVDAAQLERALANLVHNAVAATPAGGVVRVDVTSNHGRVQVSVIDECGGLPAGDFARLFDVGWRGKSSRTREGAGLGLAVAQGIVQAHGGNIEASNLDGGCCFVVILSADPSPIPTSSSTQTMPARPGPAAPPSPHRSRHRARDRAR